MIRDRLLLDPAVSGEIAWTLLHFLWQGLALAALLWVALKIPRQSPRVRYYAASTTLALMALAPLVTYWAIRGEFNDPGPLTLPPDLAALTAGEPPRTYVASTASTRPLARPARAAATVATTTDAAGPTAPSERRSLVSLPASWLFRVRRAVPWIVLTWIAFALLLSLRQVAAMFLLRWSLRRGTVPLRDGFERLDELPARVGVRKPVNFRECSMWQVPATVGWRRPVVLVPSAVLDTLWPRQLDALVAHELAHVRRNDYLVNLVQSVLESLLAFHPAVWWASARVREERESCCDELAADVVGSRKEYASALATMEQLRPRIFPTAATPALSAAGGPLLRRIERLARAASDPFSPRRGSRFAPAAVLAPLVTAGVLFLAASQLIATSVNVEPPHELHDVGALGAAVYKALGVSDPAASARGDGHAGSESRFLTHYRLALASTNDQGQTFDRQNVDDLVDAVLRDSRHDALATIQLALTDLHRRDGFERRPEWQFRSQQVRIRLLGYLLERATAARPTNPAAARKYARAAFLLAAQDSALNATFALGRVLRHESIRELAELSPREWARINRAVDDHRVILRVAQQEMARALYAVRALAAERSGRITIAVDDAAAMRDQLLESIEVMLRVSRGRSDIEWTTAKFCRDARAVLGADDAHRFDRQLLHTPRDGATPYLRRWIAYALALPAPQVLPSGHEGRTVDEELEWHQQVKSRRARESRPTGPDEERPLPR